MSLVSIVLPAYNEENEILSALHDLDSQTYQDKEIIVVDDGSTDSTASLAESFAARNDHTKVIRAKHAGPSAARNLGIKFSSGDVIFFGECDCSYDSRYVERAMNALRANPEAGAVCLTGAPLKVRSNLVTNSIELENLAQHTLLKLGRIKPFYAWVYRRNVLHKTGGFDESLFQAEDRDLFFRVTSAGYRVVLVPGVNWWHKRSQGVKEFVASSFRRGKNRIEYILKHDLFVELIRSVAPLWMFLLGIILLPFYSTYGTSIIFIDIALFLFRAYTTEKLTAGLVPRIRTYFEYPLFVMLRNFSTALGYTVGLLLIPIRGIRRSSI